MKKTPKKLAVRGERNVRELLRQIGVGHFNITMMIPYMFIAPATTDPRAAQIVILVQHVQQQLAQMGFPVQITGYLDRPTQAALQRVAGPRWESLSWSDNVSAIINAKNEPVAVATLPSPPKEGVGLFEFLPDVPGGLITYAVGGFLLYRHFAKR